MGMQIEDGHGSGNHAQVVEGNKLYCKSVTSTREHETNHDDGGAYNVVFSQSPTAADDCIFYMVNTDDEDMSVGGVTIGFINATAVDAEIYFQIGDSGTRNAATALTPANLNAGSGKSADGTFEKGADLDGGAATLTGGVEFERLVFANVQDVISFPYNFEQDVILPKNRALTIWATDADATYYMTLAFNYHSKT